MQLAHGASCTWALLGFLPRWASVLLKTSGFPQDRSQPLCNIVTGKKDYVFLTFSTNVFNSELKYFGGGKNIL